MAAYLIALVDVSDPEQYKQYSARAGAAVAKHGGRFIVRNGEREVVEGKVDYERIVVVEFPDKATAHAFYHSPDYQEARGFRLAAADFNGVIIEGA